MVRLYTPTGADWDILWVAFPLPFAVRSENRIFVWPRHSCTDALGRRKHQPLLVSQWELEDVL